MRTQSIFPGIDCLFAPGHTPGSAIFSITSGSEQALILGDAVHCVQELVDPECRMGGDVDPALAEATRDRIRLEATECDALVAAAHFPRLRFGRLSVGERTRHWRFAWA